MKPGNVDVKHNRFYIFRHNKGDMVQFLNAGGHWVDAFDQADLITDHDYAVATAQDAQFKLPPNSQMQLVLGQVVVDTNPFFSGEAV